MPSMKYNNFILTCRIWIDWVLTFRNVFLIFLLPWVIYDHPRHGTPTYIHSFFCEHELRRNHADHNFYYNILAKGYCVILILYGDDVFLTRDDVPSLTCKPDVISHELQNQLVVAWKLFLARSSLMNANLTFNCLIFQFLRATKLTTIQIVAHLIVGANFLWKSIPCVYSKPQATNLAFSFSTMPFAPSFVLKTYLFVIGHFHVGRSWSSHVFLCMTMSYSCCI